MLIRELYSKHNNLLSDKALNEYKMQDKPAVKKWFSGSGIVYNGFLKAMLKSDLKAMNAYMNKIALTTFSYFDSGRKSSQET